LDKIIIQFLNGLTFGGLLFLISSGFTLLFGVMQVVNMAHGMFYIVGAYIGLTVQKQTGNWFLAIIAGSITVGIIAFLVEKLIRFVKSDLTQALLTLGIAVAIRDLCLIIWGGLPQIIKEPSFTQFPIKIFGFTYPGYRLFILVLSIFIGVLMWFLLKSTQYGRIIRAGTDNRKMVSALGINIDRTYTTVFVIAGLLTGLSGAAGGTYIGFGPGTDFTILTYALVVVIMGGLGSIPGAALGAIIVGLVDSFGRTYVPQLTNFLMMGSLVIVLLFRPTGLLGRKE
jgi:branched-chain amino acid transport system permease protein